VFGLFDVQTLSPASDSGAAPVGVYRVLRARTHSLARTLRGVEESEPGMVGRFAELGHLQSAFTKAVEQRQLQIVTVVGEAGLGKSRLLREFQRWLQVVPYRGSIFCGRAEAETSSLPFSLLRDVFRSRFEILESDSASVAWEK